MSGLIRLCVFWRLVQNVMYLFIGLASSFVQASNCTDAPVDGALYSVINLESGKSLDIMDASRTAGGTLKLWGYAGSNNQLFYLKNVGNGFWTFQAKHSGMLLDVARRSESDGADILQWPATGSSNQQWRLKQSSITGAYNIIARHSGKSMTASGSAHGDNVMQAQGVASGYQRWFLNPVSIPCGSSPDGFAAQPGRDGLATTTGGGLVQAQVVTSCSSLAAALSALGAAVVQIPDNTTIDCRTAARPQVACPLACPSHQDPGKTWYRVPVGSQTCTELGSPSNATVMRSRNESRLHVASNKTLPGMGKYSRVLGGSFDLSNARNVIIRNLTIEQVNPGLIEAGDGITLNGSSHVWVDHVRFNLISDGHIDIKNSENVTLSWNHFNGYNPQVCGNKHWYTSSLDNSVVTLHHNFWDNAAGRNPKIVGITSRAHLFNNYWKNIYYFSVGVNNAAQAKLEGNYFDNAAKPHWNQGNGYLDANVDVNRYTGASATDNYRHSTGSVFGDISLYPYNLEHPDTLPARLATGTGPQ